PKRLPQLTFLFVSRRPNPHRIIARHARIADKIPHRGGRSLNTSINETENLLFITLLQLIVMVGAARYMHTVFRRLGQPGVIGEIFAGLLLGPSLVGHFFPQASLA